MCLTSDIRELLCEIDQHRESPLLVSQVEQRRHRYVILAIWFGTMRHKNGRFAIFFCTWIAYMSCIRIRSLYGIWVSSCFAMLLWHIKVQFCWLYLQVRTFSKKCLYVDTKSFLSNKYSLTKRVAKKDVCWKTFGYLVHLHCHRIAVEQHGKEKPIAKNFQVWLPIFLSFTRTFKISTSLRKLPTFTVAISFFVCLYPFLFLIMAD